MDNFLSICICALHVIHLSKEISKMKSTKKMQNFIDKKGKKIRFFLVVRKYFKFKKRRQK